jgi:hypothetical protein
MKNYYENDDKNPERYTELENLGNTLGLISPTGEPALRYLLLHLILLVFLITHPRRDSNPHHPITLALFRKQAGYSGKYRSVKKIRGYSYHSKHADNGSDGPPGKEFPDFPQSRRKPGEQQQAACYDEREYIDEVILTRYP